MRVPGIATIYGDRLWISLIALAESVVLIIRSAVNPVLWVSGFKFPKYNLHEELPVLILRITLTILIAAQFASIGGLLVLAAFLVIGSKSYFLSWLQMTPAAIVYSWVAVNSVAVAIAFPLRLIFSSNYSILVRVLIGAVSGAVIYPFVLWQFGAMQLDELYTGGWFQLVVGSIYGTAFTVSTKLAEALVARWRESSRGKTDV